MCAFTIKKSVKFVAFIVTTGGIIFMQAENKKKKVYKVVLKLDVWISGNTSRSLFNGY